MLLKRLLDQLQNDKKIFIQQKEELFGEAESGLNSVTDFLREELKVDLPTGRERMHHADTKSKESSLLFPKVKVIFFCFCF